MSTLVKKIIVYTLLSLVYLALYFYCSNKNFELTTLVLSLVGTVTIANYIGDFTDWLFDNKEG